MIFFHNQPKNSIAFPLMFTNDSSEEWNETMFSPTRWLQPQTPMTLANFLFLHKSCQIFVSMKFSVLTLFILRFSCFWLMYIGNFWTLLFYLTGEEWVKAWVVLEQMGRYLGKLVPKGSTVHFVRYIYINIFSSFPILLYFHI